MTFCICASGAPIWWNTLGAIRESVSATFCPEAGSALRQDTL